MMSLGYDAAVLAELEKSRNGPIRLYHYILPILSQLKHYRLRPFMINSNAYSYTGFILSVLHCYAQSWLYLKKPTKPNWLGYGNCSKSLFVYLKAVFLMAIHRLDRCQIIEQMKKEPYVIKSAHAVPLQIDGEYIGDFKQLAIRMTDQRLTFFTNN